MEVVETAILPTVLTAMSAVAAVLLGVWAIVARYDARMRDRIDAQSREIGQLRERMAKLEGLLEGLREAITGKRAA